jgi:hypothetical protein
MENKPSAAVVLKNVRRVVKVLFVFCFVIFHLLSNDSCLNSAEIIETTLHKKACHFKPKRMVVWLVGKVVVWL